MCDGDGSCVMKGAQRRAGTCDVYEGEERTRGSKDAAGAAGPRAGPHPAGPRQTSSTWWHIHLYKVVNR